MYPTRRLTAVTRMARRAKQITAATEMIKWIVKKKKGKVEKWSLQVEKGSHLRASSVLMLILKNRCIFRQISRGMDANTFCHDVFQRDLP